MSHSPSGFSASLRIGGPSSSSQSFQSSSFQSSGGYGASGSASLGAGSGNYGASYGSGSASHTASGHSGSSGSAGTVGRIAEDLLLLNQGSGSTSRGSVAGAAGGSAGFSSGSASHSFQHQSSGSFGASASFGASSSGSVSGSAGGSSTFLSEIEQHILRSNIPIESNETEELTVSFKGAEERGIWLNRQEVINWRGIIPITEYIINEDLNPEIITKRTEQSLVYIQELAIRYLRPPTPPAPGEILITQEMNTLTPPAPPLIIRQQPARADTPEPLVIREAPPEPPAAVGRKIITISGKRIPPPPRKVIIERLAPLPSKPQSVLVERWLPYAQVKRRVIFQRSNERDAVVVKPRNVIVQWEAPSVTIKKEFKYLGVIRANPAEYVARYGATLKLARELPDFVLDIKTPDGLVLAADYKYESLHELEGDVQALKFIDLEREGLSEYRSYLARLGINFVGHEGLQAALASFQGGSSSASFQASSSSSQYGASSQLGSAGLSISQQAENLGGGSSSAHHSAHQSGHHSSHHSAHHSSHGANAGGALSHHSSHGAGAGGAISSLAAAQDNQASLSLSHSQSFTSSSSIGNLIERIFRSISKDDKISLVEAQGVLLRLNSRLGRRYGEDEVKAFYNVLDVNHDGSIDLEEFKKAFINVHFSE